MDFKKYHEYIESKTCERYCADEVQELHDECYTDFDVSFCDEDAVSGGISVADKYYQLHEYKIF